MVVSGINWFQGSIDFIQDFFLRLTSQFCVVSVNRGWRGKVWVGMCVCGVVVYQTFSSAFTTMASANVDENEFFYMTCLQRGE